MHLSEKVDEERAPVCLLLPALDFLMLALLQSSPGHLVTAENGRAPNKHGLLLSKANGIQYVPLCPEIKSPFGL